MRTVLIAGALGALLAPPALAQTRVELGDGVSVVFPSAPGRIQTAIDRTPAPPSNLPPMPVDPRDQRARDQHLRSTDLWALRQGGAAFMASASTPFQAYSAKCIAGPGVGPAGGVITCRKLDGGYVVRETRRVSDDGRLDITQTLERNGRSYMISFMRPGPEQLKKLSALGPAPSDADGEAFLSSLRVGPTPAK
jgi:hypothetical protein